MKTIGRTIIGLGLFALLVTLPAQAALESTPTNTLVAAVAAEAGLPVISVDEISPLATFFVVSDDSGGNVMPYPCPPPGLENDVPYTLTPTAILLDATTQPVTSLSSEELTNQATALLTFIDQELATVQKPLGAMSLLSADDLTPPGDGDTNDYGGYTNSFVPFPLDTNTLWIEISNVDNTAGIAYANLHKATNLVYGIKVATSLTGSWQVENEVWPTDTNCQPFTMQTLGRDTLFLRAEDWTDVDANSNGLYDWWEWKYFGDFNQTASGDYDGDGVDNATEYANGTDPNKINFTVRLGNQHFNTTYATGAHSVSSGVPSFAAVLVNDTNLDDATWQSYNGHISFMLGPTNGAYQVLFGLKGRASDSVVTWMGTTVYLDQTAPVLAITNPANSTVTLPYIQLQGYADEPLSAVAYDLSNSVGVVTGAVGHVTGQLFDTNSLTFTTNYFQCFDVPLAEGTNILTVYGMDLAGNTGSTNISITLDYASATNPPGITLGWPADGMEIGQSNITVYGTLSDPTASISLQVTDGSNTNEIAGIVERDGHFWIQNVPLTGTNTLTLTAVDVRTNTATMSLTVHYHNTGLSINPVTSDLWESTATVSGTIGNTNDTVTVNGMVATNNGDGTWTAYDVPVNPDNVAVFNVTALSAGGTNAVQQTAVKPAALKLVAATLTAELAFIGPEGYGYPEHSVTTWNWTATKGGSYYSEWDEPAMDGEYAEENSGMIKPDRTLPLLHYTDSHGGDRYFTNANVVGNWQADFPQENGALAAAAYTGLYWEEKSGQAMWVLHTGLDVAGMNPMLLFELSASAEEEKMAADGSGLIHGMNDLLGPDITDIGEQLDTNYLAYVALQNGATVNAPITVNASLSTVNGGKTKYTLKHTTYYPALTDTNLSRTTVGVGEEVSFGFQPAMPYALDWTTTAGSVSPAFSSSTTLTSPSNTVSGLIVRAKLRGGKSVQFPPFTVVEPAGIDHAEIISTNHYPIETSEAGMQLAIWVAPTSVSFYRVNIMEVGEPASNITGYFISNTPPSHIGNGANNWIHLSSDNSLAGGGTDDCFLGPCFPPWSTGGFEWDIPARWQVEGSGVTNSMAGYNQVFSINSAGMLTIQKFGRSVTRTTNDVITIN